MDTFENKAPVQPAENDLTAQFEALRHLVFSILVLVLVISGTLNIYLLRQVRYASKDLAAIRPQAAQMIAEYQKVSGPLMNDFIKKVSDYGHTHPDFAPVLAKYRHQTRPGNFRRASRPASDSSQEVAQRPLTQRKPPSLPGRAATAVRRRRSRTLRAAGTAHYNPDSSGAPPHVAAE